MVDEKYFFDTYALAEIANGNENYGAYAECECLTGQFNTIELYYAVLRKSGRHEAEKQYHRIKHNVTRLADEDVFAGMSFKLTEKKRRLSYADCIGYTIAKRLGVKFLTGDEEFKGMPNVEFVK